MILSIQYAILVSIYSVRKGKGSMCEEKIKAVVAQFAKEAEKIYGTVLRAVILYGSCARGDFADDSDIDVMVLLDAAQLLFSQGSYRIANNRAYYSIFHALRAFSQ